MRRLMSQLFRWNEKLDLRGKELQLLEAAGRSVFSPLLHDQE